MCAHERDVELVDSSPIRVAIVIDDLRVAGAQEIVRLDAQAFNPSRVSMTVIALERTPGNTIESSFAVTGVPVFYAPGCGFVDRRGLLDPQRWLGLAMSFHRIKPDIVQTHLTAANVFGVIVARLMGRPVVATLQNVVSSSVGRRGVLKQALEGWVLRLLATEIVCVGQAMVGEASQNYGIAPSRLVVIQNAVDLYRIRLPNAYDREEKRRGLGVPPGVPLLVTVARLTVDKGHSFLLEAACQLAGQREVYLVFAGAGPEEDRLRAQVARLGIAERVRFLGVRADVPEVVAAADLFVLPSLNEGLSLAMLEAMGLGVPVVVTEVGSAADVIRPGETGRLVLAGSAARLAAAIDEALADPEGSQAMADRARALVRRDFSQESHARRLEALYRQAMEPLPPVT